MTCWRSGKRLAIELDRTSKPQSIVKLRALRDAGCRVLWLRWNDGNHRAETLPPDVSAHWLSIADPQPLARYLDANERRKATRRRKHAAK